MNRSTEGNEMTLPMRGRSLWWRPGQDHPPASEPAPEPVAQATGLPVAAPPPAGGTDDLSASTLLNRVSVQPEIDRRDAEIADLQVRLAAETRAARRWMAEANQAEAAVARVKVLHVNEHGSCAGCMDVCSVSCSWPCPTSAALDPPAPVESDLPAVREFVAGFDPRGES